MSTSNKSGLSGKCVGLNIENQVTTDFFVSDRHLTVIPDIKSHHHIAHFFLNCLAPHICPRSLVNVQGLLD